MCVCTFQCMYVYIMCAFVCVYVVCMLCVCCVYVGAGDKEPTDLREHGKHIIGESYDLWVA